MANAPTVLLVEDDRVSRSATETVLLGAGLSVVLADTVESGWQLFLAHKPTVAILDVSLPDGSGIDLCRRIREHKTLGGTAVIMLTGQSGIESKRGGFDAGADQYLVKPVPPEELALWARALLRRLAIDQGESDVVVAGDCEIDVNAHAVRWQGSACPRLTLKEFDLLYFLVTKRPRVYTRAQILKQVWDTITVDQVVDAHIHNLRKKLPPPLAARLQNIPGKGFRFIE
ncbi:MAG: response regulator transcription factor [Elusimicrobia bacterium]|nr:response regulator transcription factor [Elusimicrobiota bacterium]